VEHVRDVGRHGGLAEEQVAGFFLYLAVAFGWIAAVAGRLQRV
jgi:hypothetical protein